MARHPQPRRKFTLTGQGDQSSFGGWRFLSVARGHDLIGQAGQCLGSPVLANQRLPNYRIIERV
jgi:hypothetical protein